MKILAPLTAVMLIVALCPVSAQSLEKGNLVGVHTLTISLDRDATFNDYKKYLQDQWIPANNKLNPDAKLYLLEGIRGEGEGSLGFVFVFKNAEARDKYWNKDGTPSEFGQKMFDEMQPVTEAGEKIGTWSSTYTDWIVQ